MTDTNGRRILYDVPANDKEGKSTSTIDKSMVSICGIWFIYIQLLIKEREIVNNKLTGENKLSVVLWSEIQGYHFESKKVLLLQILNLENDDSTCYDV